MIHLLTDEHIPTALVEALRQQGVEVARVRDVGLASTPDPDILGWAAGRHRVFVTFDRNTVPGFAYDRVRNGLPMPGVIVFDDALSIGAMTDELHIAAVCGTPDDFRDQVIFLPR